MPLPMRNTINLGSSDVKFSEPSYTINEIFYSLQGEGMRAGTANVFVRFSGCNLKCDVKPGEKSPGGFACDTEFASGRKMSLKEIHEGILAARNIAIGLPKEHGSPQEWGSDLWLILSGGEPGLQVDRNFCNYFHALGMKLAIETNGTVELPNDEPQDGDPKYYSHPGDLLDWVTVSPKVAEHAIKQLTADEVKYVRGYGQPIPKTSVIATHYLISPAFEGGILHPATLEWCTRLCLENPKWRLSLQTHKFLNVR